MDEAGRSRVRPEVFEPAAPGAGPAGSRQSW